MKTAWTISIGKPVLSTRVLINSPGAHDNDSSWEASSKRTRDVHRLSIYVNGAVRSYSLSTLFYYVHRYTLNIQRYSPNSDLAHILWNSNSIHIPTFVWSCWGRSEFLWSWEHICLAHCCTHSAWYDTGNNLHPLFSFNSIWHHYKT